MEEALKKLAEHGPVGIMLGLSLLANWKQYQDVKAALQDKAGTAARALLALQQARELEKRAASLELSARNALRQTPSNRR